jgi:putative transposase
VQPRAYKRTTVPGDDPVESVDLIGRDFAAGGAPGQRLVGDITYLRTGEGWLYLATVIDLATRMVVGWQLATHMRTSLVVDALQMALDARLVAPEAIFPSDRGCQGGFNWSSQHLDRGGVDGQACRLDDCVDRALADEVAWSAVA